MISMIEKQDQKVPTIIHVDSFSDHMVLLDITLLQDIMADVTMVVDIMDADMEALDIMDAGMKDDVILAADIEVEDIQDVDTGDNRV